MPPATQSYRCLSCRFAQLTISTSRRQFHASTPKPARKPAYPNIKASDLGLINTSPIHASPVNTKPYSDEERALLETKYTPEQMAIIDIGEEAIPAEDLIKQGLQRTDPNRIAYFDDFSTDRPLIDHEPAESAGQTGADELKSRPIKYSGLESADADGKDKIDPNLLRLSQQTGLDSRAIQNLHVRTLVKRRVVNQTRMGKIPSMYYLAVAGDRNGMLGIGEGKSAEDADAERQAKYAAIRNMKPIERYEDRTIYGEVQAKVAATIVQLQTRPPGFGNRCQHLIFEMARCAGISDLAARTPRSRNKMNVVKAAYAALLSQRTAEEVAKSRGRKLIDVRKVYYGGSVP